MARTESITFEQVANAANTLKAAGVKPNSRNIREALGSGSMSTVCRHLAKWSATQQPAGQVVDDVVDPSVIRAISGYVSTKVHEATSLATAALADLQDEHNALITESERLSSDLDIADAERASLSDQMAAMAGRIAQLEADAVRAAQDLLHERQAAEFARVELAKAELRLEAVPRIEREVEQLRQSLEGAKTHTAEQHEAAAVAQAKYEAAERAAAAASAATVEASTRAQQTEQALAAERLAVQSAMARLEAAAREVAEAKDTAIKATAMARAASEEAAMLRGQVVELSKKAQAVKEKP
jgi:chromosome segregation ATPase